MKKIITLLLALNILAFGTALCNITGLGIDAPNAFVIIMSELTHIQIGTFFLGLQFFIGIFVFIFKRENIGIGTVIPMIFFGYFLQFYNWLVPQFIPIINNYILNILLFIVGTLIIGFGIAMVMSCGIGMVPYDSIAFILSDRLGKSPAIYRVGVDTTVGIAAFILGGPINVGTIILSLFIGPLIDFYRKNVFHKMFIE